MCESFFHELDVSCVAWMFFFRKADEGLKKVSQNESSGGVTLVNNKFLMAYGEFQDECWPLISLEVSSQRCLNHSSYCHHIETMNFPQWPSYLISLLLCFIDCKINSGIWFTKILLVILTSSSYRVRVSFVVEIDSHCISSQHTASGTGWIFAPQ